MAALDIICAVERPRSWLRKRLVAIALGLGSVAVFLVVTLMLVVGPLFGGGRALAGLLGAEGAFGVAWDWLDGPVALAALTAWATALFRLAPRRKTSWGASCRGAARSRR